MKKIVIASKNPVKINAAMAGFRVMFPDEEFVEYPVAVASGVDDQPMSSEETLLGAKNRAKAAKLAEPAADYWVGLEGGIYEEGDEMWMVEWTVVMSINQMGIGRGSSFRIPKKIAEHVRSGKEINDANKEVLGTENSGQKSGAVGILTKEAIGRTEVYTQMVILALIPLANPELYPDSFV